MPEMIDAIETEVAREIAQAVDLAEAGTWEASRDATAMCTLHGCSMTIAVTASVINHYLSRGLRHGAA